MLYWDDPVIDPSLTGVLDRWTQHTPGWNLSLYNERTARDYLREHFGQDIARTFLTCALPAMRSDFFRVFWALREGGLYSDVTFVPTREPAFFDGGRNMTLVRFKHGRIVNGIFRAKADCPELHRVADRMLANMARRDEDNLWLVTGPGAWIQALDRGKAGDIEILEHAELFPAHMDGSRYKGSTRATDRHWSRLQKVQGIYRDPPTEDGANA